MSLGIMDMLSGDAVELVGVDAEPEGGVRLFVGARYDGLYFVVTGEDADRALVAWASGGRILMRRDELPGLYVENAAARTWPG